MDIEHVDKVDDEGEDHYETLDKNTLHKHAQCTDITGYTIDDCPAGISVKKSKAELLHLIEYQGAQGCYDVDIDQFTHRHRIKIIQAGTEKSETENRNSDPCNDR